jgi:hypothetical protein
LRGLTQGILFRVEDDMSREIEEQVSSLIAKGKTKKQIFEILSREMPKEDFERFLRNQTERTKKESYYGWNLLLVAIVAAVTFFKLGKILTPLFEHGVHNVLMTAWGLLVPGVNLCLMWLTYRFNRLGYIGLLILNVLSLVRPEIRSAEGLVQTVPVIVLSGFLYMKLFPKGGKDY